MSDRTLRITGSDRVMVLAVHPDDESLATGGVLQRAVAAGAAVRVLFITDGENNPWPQRVLERRWQITPADRARWGQRRRREALAALARLGVPAADARFLGWPDQGLTRLLLGRSPGEAGEMLAHHVRDWRPTLLFVPSLQDRHPDHNALAVLCRLALARSPGGDPGHGAPSVFHYLVHGPGGTSGPGVMLPLSVWEKRGKHAAISAHASQLLLSRERFLAYATDEERFAPSTPPARRGLTGASTRMSGTALTVEGRFESPLGAFERPRLHLVFPSRPADAGGIMAWTIPLGGADGGTAPILRGHDAAVVGEASVHLHRRQQVSVRLLLMRHQLPAGRIFLKLRRRQTFLDASGWDELSLIDEILPGAPGRTVVPSVQAARSW